MAIVDFVTHQQISRFKGHGGLLGTAVGIGVSLAYSLGEYYEWTWPGGGNILTPPKGVAGLDVSQTTNGSTNSKYQALRALRKYSRRERYKKKHGSCRCCC